MLIKFLVSLLVVIPYIYLKSKKSLHMLQQNWYNDGNRYLKWIGNNKNKVFVNFDIFFLIFFLGFLTNRLTIMTVFILFYSLCCLDVEF